MIPEWDLAEHTSQFSSLLCWMGHYYVRSSNDDIRLISLQFINAVRCNWSLWGQLASLDVKQLKYFNHWFAFGRHLILSKIKKTPPFCTVNPAVLWLSRSWDLKFFKRGVRKQGMSTLHIWSKHFCFSELTCHIDLGAVSVRRNLILML